jgi:NAD(P)-dependent dehydrogenase (short-subunit alcohol dehydrogenase family)
MTPELAGRRALVTGAGSRIGEACVRLLADRGAAVGVIDVREDAVRRVVRELSASGARAVGATCDVGSERDVAATVDEVARQLDGLDTIVAAAGIARAGRTLELSLSEWETVIRVNLTGVFLTLKHTLGHLASAGGGAVVTIGSVASLVATGRAPSYDASKGEVLQLTRAIAAEYVDQNIRANCVCPGLVATRWPTTAAICTERWDGAPNGSRPRGHGPRSRGPRTQVRSRRWSRFCAPVRRRS